MLGFNHGDYRSLYKFIYCCLSFCHSIVLYATIYDIIEYIKQYCVEITQKMMKNIILMEGMHYVSMVVF